MACGLPIVATDLQGIRDYTDAACARLAPKGDASTMAEVVVALAADEVKRRQMATASRDQALAFRWENVAAQVKRVYAQI
jgi:glycosyltransferase involved in cell wall biosynthesis